MNHVSLIQTGGMGGHLNDMIDPVYKPIGDRGLLVELGNEISLDINRQVRSLLFGLEGLSLKGVREILPAYCSVLIVFDPLVLSQATLRAKIRTLMAGIDEFDLPQPKSIRVPVAYGGNYGPDLESVARYHNLEPEEVIRHHTSTTYHVFMLGFTPGFPYLGELPGRIVTPRRETPRTHVPRGSVGIAQKQTGIYPTKSPGGWQIIGRTPLTLFDPEGSPPTLFDIGDRVTFYPIKAQEIESWKA